MFVTETHDAVRRSPNGGVFILIPFNSTSTRSNTLWVRSKQPCNPAHTCVTFSRGVRTLFVRIQQRMTRIAVKYSPSWVPFQRRIAATKKLIDNTVYRPYNDVKKLVEQGIAPPSLARDILTGGTDSATHEHRGPWVTGSLYGAGTETVRFCLFTYRVHCADDSRLRAQSRRSRWLCVCIRSSRSAHRRSWRRSLATACPSSRTCRNSLSFEL